MNPALLYSPRPPEAYSRRCGEVGLVGVGIELSGEECRAAWNLYYLSDPAVDSFLTGWGSGPSLDIEMLRACMRAQHQKLGGEIVRDVVLREPAPVFAQLVASRPHKHLAPYRLGREKWLATITARAGHYRGLVAIQGNLITGSFGRKMTKPPGSAIIMPLSFPKSTR